MKFTTTILDRNNVEWSLIGEVVGKGMYDDNGDKAALVVEDFDIVDIALALNDARIKVESYKVMPDIFNEREIRHLVQDATDAFLEDWMDVQDCAHDNSISQKLA